MKKMGIICLAAILSLLLTACGGLGMSLRIPNASSPAISQESSTRTPSSSQPEEVSQADASSPSKPLPSAGSSSSISTVATQQPGTSSSASSSVTSRKQTAVSTSRSTATTTKPTAKPTTKPTVKPTTKPAPKPTAKPSSAPPPTTKATTKATTPPTTSAPRPIDRAKQVLDLVNAERAKAGVAPLTMNQELSANANVRAKELITSFSHTRPDGTRCFTAITVPYRTAGENIAYGYPSAEDVMEGWMNSDGHRANILASKYAEIGIGVVEDQGILYWVQLFIG